MCVNTRATHTCVSQRPTTPYACTRKTIAVQRIRSNSCAFCGTPPTCAPQPAHCCYTHSPGKERQRCEAAGHKRTLHYARLSTHCPQACLSKACCRPRHTEGGTACSCLCIDHLRACILNARHQRLRLWALQRQRGLGLLTCNRHVRRYGQSHWWASQAHVVTEHDSAAMLQTLCLFIIAGMAGVFLVRCY